jgi:hypothetical protein
MGHRYTLGDQGSPPAPGGTLWNIELVDSPDAVLADYPGLVATSDSIILDECDRWVNLAGDVVKSRVPEAWIVELRHPDAAGC